MHYHSWLAFFFFFNFFFIHSLSNCYYYATCLERHSLMQCWEPCHKSSFCLMNTTNTPGSFIHSRPELGPLCPSCRDTIRVAIGHMEVQRPRAFECRIPSMSPRWHFGRQEHCVVCLGAVVVEVVGLLFRGLYGQSLTTSTCLGIDVVQEGDCGLEDLGRA